MPLFPARPAGEQLGKPAICLNLEEVVALLRLMKDVHPVVRKACELFDDECRIEATEETIMSLTGAFFTLTICLKEIIAEKDLPKDSAGKPIRPEAELY